jgi:nucleotide-binding universal stress UspA family protein
MTATCLIPTDGSELSAKVVDPLRALVRGEELRLVLLRVIPAGATAEQEALLDAAQAELNALREQLEADGTVETRIERGDPADRILAVADEVEPTLIAMTSHGRSGLSRMVRGSVAERVLRHAKQPLLICNPKLVQTPKDGFKRILVPLDGSDRSAEILDHVIRLAKAYQSKVTLLRVEPFLYSAMPSPALNPDLWDAEATRASLHPARDRLSAAGVEDITVEAAYGVEAAEILNAANDCDLVVMSTHGRSGPSRWWFGSVAESVLRHCEHPLYVLRSA